MRLAAAAFLALALGACRTPCPPPYTGPTTVNFTCENGSALTVTFSRGPDMARIEEEGYTTLTLPARPATTGYRYVGEGSELRSRGGDAGWTRPGAPEVLCRQAAAAAR